MKLLSIIALLTMLPIAAAFTSQTSAGNPGAIPATAGAETVEPGETHTNGDGVTVENFEDSGKNIKVTPKNGHPGSITKVVCEGDPLEGNVDGIDGNDKVIVKSGANMTINGTGGTVEVGTGGTVTVTNTNGSGGSNITIVAGGVTVTVYPGMTVPVSG